MDMMLDVLRQAFLRKQLFVLFHYFFFLFPYVNVRCAYGDMAGGSEEGIIQRAEEQARQADRFLLQKGLEKGKCSFGEAFTRGYE
jgi:hypothetical protein